MATTQISDPAASTAARHDASAEHRLDLSAWGAEAVGTFVLVLGGVGAAVLAGDTIGVVGVALVFGLVVTAMGSAVGHLSGGHFNPAVTVGMAFAGRLPAAQVVPYLIAQLAGGTLGAAVLYEIASGRPAGATGAGFATNGYGAQSPGGFSLTSAFLAEAVLTGVFVLVIALVTASDHPTALTPLVIGLTLTSLILVAAPVTNASLNPVRSLAPAWFVPSSLHEQWVFVLAPLLGGAVAGLIARSWRTATA
ncbi:aquaporin [Nocardioides sp. TRM66260-LWL]|uniref:aquaporin n=1 Tax=Nocardioides sp. TRM66260-LWL TaxID=2874478 RepID=UPI001CC75CD1|nr:aquaporin [Nocardioides sp. TRM66260-LWL]MBZ5735738.1 aquaporin [Nocardioides sp. TRM66260-LWL]